MDTTREMEAGLSGKGRGSEVWEAAGIFFVVVGNRKNGVVELVVAELLKGHGGSDGGENRDVWKWSTSSSSSEHTHYFGISVIMERHQDSYSSSLQMNPHSSLNHCIKSSSYYFTKAWRTKALLATSTIIKQYKLPF